MNYLPSKGGNRRNEIKYPPMAQPINKISKEKKFPSGMACPWVKVYSMIHSCRQTTPNCMYVARFPCSGSIKLCLNRSNRDGYSGRGLWLVKQGIQQTVHVSCIWSILPGFGLLFTGSGVSIMTSSWPFAILPLTCSCLFVTSRWRTSEVTLILKLDFQLLKEKNICLHI